MTELRRAAAASVLPRAGRAYRSVVALLQRADPVRLLLRASADGTVLLACVYRASGVRQVQLLLDQLPAQAQVRLWSLDGQVPAALRAVTVGTGPGTRAQLLNRLVADADADVVVLADDDVRFAIGHLRELLDAGRRLRLDVYQPAHLASSHASWDFVRRRRGTFGRVTDFVEQGPLLVLNRRGRAVVLPLPEDDGMAWGVEVEWAAEAAACGARLGIVDAVAVRHLAPPALTYHRAGAQDALDGRLSAHGLHSLEQLHVVRCRVSARSARRQQS